MARQPLPDILAPHSADIIDAVLGNSRKDGDTSWHRREMDYPINRVRVGRRLRPLRDVSGLADSMQEIGLINRINLLPDGTLIAGRHRLAAAQSLGWETIPAVILELGELDTELAEIDENLRRTELTVLEQAQHFARRDEILRAKGLRAAASNGRNQYTEVGAPGAPTITTADMAEQMNISERAAQERLQIARAILPAVQDALASHPVANSTKGLLAIARQDEATQVAIADMLVDGGVASVTDALGILERLRKEAEVEEMRQSVVKSEESGSRQQGAELAKCRICKRPLTDPEHAAAGIGPCCAAKEAAGGDGGADAADWAEAWRERHDDTRLSRCQRLAAAIVPWAQAWTDDKGRTWRDVADKNPQHANSPFRQDLEAECKRRNIDVVGHALADTIRIIFDVLPTWSRPVWSDDTVQPEATPVSQRDGYDSDEWYTPAAYIEAARAVMGEIELDPASCALAQTVVKAARYIDKEHDGLRMPWCTPALWLNPPYSASQAWVDKLLDEFDDERTDAAIVLVNNATETRWFQAMLRRFPVCFPAARLQFWRHDHENVGARQGQALFILTRDERMRMQFASQFGQFGPVLSIH